jgi:hypothetical protein
MRPDLAPGGTSAHRSRETTAEAQRGALLSHHWAVERDDPALGVESRRRGPESGSRAARARRDGINAAAARRKGTWKSATRPLPNLRRAKEEARDDDRARLRALSLLLVASAIVSGATSGQAIASPLDPAQSAKTTSAAARKSCPVGSVCRAARECPVGRVCLWSADHFFGSKRAVRPSPVGQVSRDHAAGFPLLHRLAVRVQRVSRVRSLCGSSASKWRPGTPHSPPRGARAETTLSPRTHSQTEALVP